MKAKIYISLVFLAAAVLLAGCQTTGDLQDDELDRDGPPDSGVDIYTPDEDCKPPCAFARSALEDPNSPLAGRLIFFDFDKSEIRSEYQQLIIDHGRYLASYPDTKVRLEGHTDERGSREYNLALGEQRAKSVRQLLLLQGVKDANINVVSFGEELPLDLGHEESAWSQNRRVEIVYETR